MSSNTIARPIAPMMFEPLIVGTVHASMLTSDISHMEAPVIMICSEVAWSPHVTISEARGPSFLSDSGMR